MHGPPSDRRLFAMCLLSAAGGIVTYAAFFQEYGSGLVLLLAIAILSLLMFADGYVGSA